MSVNPATGRNECDCCGVDLLGGGVSQCVIVSDYNFEGNAVITYEFCRDRPAEQPEGAEPGPEAEVVKGCARKIVPPSMTAHYTQIQEFIGA